MSLRDRMVECLAGVEASEDRFLTDRCAFTLSLAHRAELENGTNLVANFPRLKAQFEDCLKQESKPIIRPMALLMMSDDREDESPFGRLADLIIRRSQ